MQSHMKNISRIRNQNSRKTVPVQPSAGHQGAKSGQDGTIYRLLIKTAKKVRQLDLSGNLKSETETVVKVLRETHPTASPTEIGFTIRAVFPEISFTPGEIERLVNGKAPPIPDENRRQIYDALTEVELAVRQSNALGELMFNTLNSDTGAAFFEDGGHLAAGVLDLLSWTQKRLLTASETMRSVSTNILKI